MSRKEETLGKDDNGHRRRLATLELHLGSEYYRTGEFHNNISKAMDEHAKEVAIGFNEWSGKEGWHFKDNVVTATHKDPTILTKLPFGLWYKKGQSVGGIKSQDLYNQYIQSLTK